MSEPFEPKSVVKPVQAPGPNATPVAADDTAQKLDLLLKLMLAKEARIAEAEENTETARRARNAQRELSARTHVEKQLIKQARCQHKKGGKHGPKSGVVDFAVGMHTFINGENIIKCMICGMKWKIKDTPETLFRGNRQIANHTKIGWAQALGMVSQSTNSHTSSEVPMDAKPSVPFNGTEI